MSTAIEIYQGSQVIESDVEIVDGEIVDTVCAFYGIYRGCTGTDHLDFVIDPLEFDLDDESNMKWLCDFCQEERRQDI